MKIHALIVAINDFPGTQLDLRGCINDGDDWANILTQSSLLSTLTVLNDKKATRKAILSEAQKTLALLKPGDWGIFAVSSHGSWVTDEDGDEPDGRDEVLIPYDYKNYILDDEIHLMLQDREKGTFILLITDACHSGTVYRMIPPAHGFAPIRYLDASLISKDHKIAELTSKRVRVRKTKLSSGVVHLAGCSETQYCYDAEFNGRPNGAFTRAAIDSLSRLRVPSFRNWISMIRKYLPSYYYPQTPCLNATTANSKLLIPFYDG